jgi:hypothetical protein
MHPIVHQHEAQKSYEQDTIIDDGAPEQGITDYRNAHAPILKLQISLDVRRRR